MSEGRSHDPARMALVENFNRVKRTTKRSWRVWSNVYACPTCGLRKTALQNPNVGSSFYCHGDRVIRSRPAQQGGAEQ